MTQLGQTLERELCSFPHYQLPKRQSRWAQAARAPKLEFTVVITVQDPGSSQT